MNRSFRSLLRWSAALLGPVLLAPSSLAESSFVERYLVAVRLARAGRTAAALDQLSLLAGDAPSSVPVHRAIARLAPELGQAGLWAERFRSRRAANGRDVGAAVGLAILAVTRGDNATAHPLLLDAVQSGARDPLLAALLARTAPSAAELAGWFAARGTVLGNDSGFTVLHARVLLAVGRVPEASALVARPPPSGVPHADTLVLRAAIARAAGDDETACRTALAAAGALVGEQRTPESRVPVRLELVRAAASCPRLDEARRLIRTVGPLVSLPGDPSLTRSAALVQAEITLAGGDPIGALEILAEEGLPTADDGVDALEAALAIRARALAGLGLPLDELRAEGLAPLPAGLALADRSVTLAALAGPRNVAGREQAARTAEAAGSLRAAGLSPRAGRLALLATVQRGAAPEPGANVSADTTAAAHLVAARARLAAGDPRGALEQATAGRTLGDGTPGRILATLGLVAAHAALAVGESERAAGAVREALLDLGQAAAGEPAMTAPELEPLLPPDADLGVELAGLGYRAAVAGGRRPADAAGDLLRNLGRAVRAWSTIEVPWPATVDDLAASIPGDACAVIATPGPALAIDRRGNLATATIDTAVDTEPCENRKRILWAGPSPPPGGLAPRVDDDRVLVRLVVPSPFGEPPPRDAEPPPAAHVGPGPARPRREVVERLEPPQPDLDPYPSRFDTAREWPVFHGAGIAASGSPFAAGWLVAPFGSTPAGWMGAEALQMITPSAGAGLVALGLRTRSAPGAAETGAWVLAEAALGSGWRWALLSRRPLAREERGRIDLRLPRWADDPVREARRLAEDDPALASALTLWAAPPPPAAAANSRVALAAAGAATIALVAAVVLIVRARRRGNRPAA